MTRPNVSNLDQRLRLHCWALLDSYGGSLETVVAVACVHDPHPSDAERLACVLSAVLRDFLTDPRNRAAALTAIAASQEAA